MLKRLPELGVNFIDTADSYGPDVSEQLIREALHPYKGLVIATKAGFTRSGPNMWHVNCRPDHLIASAKKSLQKLGVEQIALWQLHRIDSRVPRAEQFGAVKQLLDEGLIAHAGLSEVSVADIKQASRGISASPRCRTATTWPTATATMWWITAQPTASASFPIIRWAATANWPGPAARWTSWPRPKAPRQGQVALAWLLKRSPMMLPIPGTSQVAHLEENVAAAAITLTDAEFAALDRKRR